MDVFALQASISLDTKGFSQNLSKAESMFNKLQKPIKALDIAIGNLMANAISRVASSIPAFAQSVVNAAAMVNAEVAQFEATFGDLGETAETVFSGMAADTGIVADRLKTLGTKAFAQFKGAGLEADEAIVEMDRHMRLAADAAAYYDISLEDADERLRSFERGNTEAGDAIGLFTSESQRNSYALERYGKKWLDLTEAQKQMLMLDVAEDIYKQNGAMGQAERESNNLANVLGNLSSVWQRDVLAVIGAPIESAFTPFVQELTEFLQDETVQAKLTEFGETLGGIASSTFDSIMNFLEYATSDETISNIETLTNNLGMIVNDISSIASTDVGKGMTITGIIGIIAKKHPAIAALLLFGTPVVSEYPKIKENAIAGYESFIADLEKFFSDPFGTIGDAWGTLDTGEESLYDKFERLRQLGGEVGESFAWIDSIPSFFESVKSAGETLISSTIERWGAADQAIQNAWKSVQDFLGVDINPYLSSFIQGVETGWNRVIGWIRDATTKTGEFLSIGIPSAFNSFIDGVVSGWNSVISWVSSAVDKVKAFLGLADEAEKTAVRIGGDGGYYGGGGKPFATGLTRVPYDNFPALLHRDEAVLTRTQAAEWRAGRSGNVDVSAIASAVYSAVVAGMSGVSVNMDSQRVGDMVTGRVSQNIAMAAWEGRYS